MRKQSQKPPPKDATYVTKGYYEGPRGVVLHKMSVSFEVKAKAHAWKELVAALRFRPETCIHGTIATFVALPAKHQELSPYLIGEVQLGARDAATAQWAFDWARAPSKPPTREMVTHSRDVGGFPGILKKLEKLWPTKTPLKLTVSATYFVDTDEWNVGPFSASNTSKPAGTQSLSMAPTHWRPEPLAGIIEEVSREPGGEEDFIFLTGKGTYNRRWTSRLLNEVDGAVWDGLKTLIKRW